MADATDPALEPGYSRAPAPPLTFDPVLGIQRGSIFQPVTGGQVVSATKYPAAIWTRTVDQPGESLWDDLGRGFKANVE